MTISKVSQIPQQCHVVNSKLKSTKELVESSTLTSIPPNYVYFDDPTLSAVHSNHDDHDYSIPIIDFSLLESESPDQLSKIVHDLGKACQNWGFFMVVNHGVSENLMKVMIDKCNEFFNLTVEEKQEFEGKHVLDPIRHGASFNSSVEAVNFWRDYLKVRRVVHVLLRGISMSLGLDEMEVEKSMNMNMGQQILIANYYPPCPQPNLAIGLAAHSDHGLLTVLAQNEVGGLQILHGDKWIPVNALPNSFLVNTGDQLEIFSNGKYKSVMHRAVVNNRATRISLAIANGPSLDKVVTVAPQLTNDEKGIFGNYKPMVYKDYILLQQSKQLHGKSCLDIIRV